MAETQDSPAHLMNATHGLPEPFGAAAERASFGIADMARDFNISPRALRFYESRGLLHPRREGANRIYGPVDRVRLAMILKGKQLGFTLAEIREMIGPPAAAGGREARLDLKPRQILTQIEHLERQRREIDAAIAELRAVHASLAERSHQRAARKLASPAARRSP